MPEAEGVEVSEKIRQSPVLGDIPIVLMTAYRMSPEEVESCVTRSGCDGLWYKPLPPMREMRDRIDAIIQERRWRKNRHP
jgi:CheY-like chemotaxis protein